MRKRPEIKKIRVSSEGTTLFMTARAVAVLEDHALGDNHSRRSIFVPEVYSVASVMRWMEDNATADAFKGVTQQAVPPVVEMTKTYWKRSGRMTSHTVLPLAAARCQVELKTVRVKGKIDVKSYLPPSAAPIVEIDAVTSNEACYVHVEMKTDAVTAVGRWSVCFADDFPISAIIRQLLGIRQHISVYHKPLVVVRHLPAYLVLSRLVKPATSSIQNSLNRLLSAIPDVEFVYAKEI